jgi:hypothetical protein
MRGSIVVLALVASPFVASISSAQGHSPKRTETPVSAKCTVPDRGNSANVISATGEQNRVDPTTRGNKDCAPPVVLNGHTSFSGSVFNDTWMANGIWDDGEPGLSGWTVQLSGSLSLSTKTDGSGAFSFAGLPGGTYTVCVVPPAGWVQSVPSGGAACASGFGYSFRAPELLIDVSYTDYDFGFQSK